ncbi:MAG: PLP-dependent aminotransferase family protein [Bacteroidales bacterium]|nr:PLP-dependent aminotransferase family protein [Bacteroidales bacterium]
MDYSRFFSEDVGSFLRSPVREIFKKVDLASIYSFAGGYPDAATFPIDDIRRLSALVLEKYGAKALQYGATQGVTELREVIAERCGVPVENVQITTSSQQGIDVCTRVFADPGDVILTTAPTYLGALQSFKSYRAEVRTVQSFLRPDELPRGESKDSDLFADSQKPPISFDPTTDVVPPLPCRGRRAPAGAVVRAAAKKVKFCYVIPDFQNPSGETMTLAEREKLVAMAREQDFLIVEDSPYRELRYSGEPVPTIYSLAPERTLHLGSFSKIFAPGFRLGWILGPVELLDRIYVCKQSLDLCPPVFDQYMAAEFMGSGALDANLRKSIALYREKRDRMLSLLDKYMPQGVSWTHPEGGLFLFLTLPEGVDTVALYDRALSAGVAYVAGSFFYPDGSHRNTMRLNFSFLDSSRMEAGVKLLAEVVSRA